MKKILVFTAAILGGITLVSCKSGDDVSKYVVYNEESDSYFANLNGYEKKSVTIPEYSNDGIHGKKKISTVINVDDMTEKINIPYAEKIRLNDTRSQASLKEISIGSTAKKISIQGYLHIEKLNVSSSNKTYKTENNVLYTSDLSELVYCPSALNSTTFDIPSTVKRISDLAFCFNSTIKEINCNDGLESIGATAMSRMSNLEKVRINSSLANIGEWAFSYDTKLTNVSIDCNINQINKFLFFGCSNMNSVTFNNKVKSIEKYAFGNPDSLYYLKEINFKGTQEEWNNINFENPLFTDEIKINFNA